MIKKGSCSRSSSDSSCEQYYENNNPIKKSLKKAKTQKNVDKKINLLNQQNSTFSRSDSSEGSEPDNNKRFEFLKDNNIFKN